MTMYVSDYCALCGHTSDESKDFVQVHDFGQAICENTDACARRQKRDVILADIQEMAKKPVVHPVDKFSRTSVAVCGFLLGAVSATGISYLLFGV